MTVSTTISRVGYAGDGVTRAFTVTFPFFDAADLQVIERVTATGGETRLSLGVHYAVSGGDGGTGTVTMTIAPPVGRQIHIRRATVLTQLVDYTPHDPFPAETHEEALDRAVLRDQEIAEMLSQTVKFPQTDASTVSATLPAAPARANKALVFDGAGNVSVSVDDYNDQVATVTAQAQAAQASASAAASSASGANSSAVAAAGSASAASGSAASAASSASAASTSRSQAATSASGAASSASSAAVHATNSAASATAAATSASNAATSASQAQTYAQQAAASGLPSPAGKALNFLRQNATETSVEYRTPSQVVTDILPAMTGQADGFVKVNATGNGVAYRSNTQTLLDLLPNMAGEALNFIRVNTTTNGLEYRDPAQVVTDILPSMAGQADGFVKVNATGNGVAYRSNTQTLLDVMPAMTNHAGEYVRVNPSQDGLEYRPPAQLLIDSLPDMTGHAGDAMLVNGSETGPAYVPLTPGFANELINGDFRIWQLGNSFSAPSGYLGWPYIADGWQWVNGATDSYARFAQYSLGNDRYALRVTREINSGRSSFRQLLRSSAVQRLRGRTVTLSFDASVQFVFSPITVSFETYQTEDATTTRTVHATQSWSMSQTWRRYSLTFTLPSNLSDLGGAVVISIPSVGTASQCYFTDFDLRVSPMVMPFERRPDAIELALCQQRIWKSYPLSVRPGASNATAGRLGWNTFGGNVINHSGLTQRVSAMRATPSAVWFSDVSGQSGYLRDNSTGTDIAVQQVLETSESASGYPQTAPVFQSGAWVTGHLVLLANI